jgi:hypothetical protein
MVFSLSRWRAGFDPRRAHGGFVVDKITLEHFFSDYFGVTLSVLFHPFSRLIFYLSSTYAIIVTSAFDSVLT